MCGTLNLGVEGYGFAEVAGRGLQCSNYRDFFTPQGRPVRATGSGRLEVLEPVGNLEDLLELGSEGEIFDSFG